ncbi:hypothetical protein AQJ54_31940, partial [Streptomyces griseorubiginosus]
MLAHIWPREQPLSCLTGLSVDGTGLLKVTEFSLSAEGVWVGVAEAVASVGEDGLQLAAGPVQLTLIPQNQGKFVAS